MTQLTPAWSIPYPDLTDTPNGAAQMQAMATKIDTLFSGADGRLTILETRTDLNGGEVKAIANQTVAASTTSPTTKVIFGGVTKTPTGITWNGSDTWTTLEDGVYSLYMSAAIQFGTSNSWSCAINGTTPAASPNAWLVAPFFATGQTDSGVSSCVWLPAGTQICGYIYNNENAIKTLNPTTIRPALFRVWRVA